MGYVEGLNSTRSKRILKKGKSYWLGHFRYPNGAIWVANYKERWYHIIFDGTGNEFFCSHDPEEISEKTAKERILRALGEDEFKKIFPEATEEEIDNLLHL